MPEIGQVVFATAGHDAGGAFVIVAIRDGACYIADGRRRKLESPKKKNPRHLQSTGKSLREEQYAANRRLRRALADAGHRDNDNQS